MTNQDSLWKEKEITKEFAKKWLDFLLVADPLSSIIPSLKSYIEFSNGSKMYMICREEFK